MDVVGIHTIYMFDLFKIWIGIEMDDLFFDGSVLPKQIWRNSYIEEVNNLILEWLSVVNLNELYQSFHLVG